MTAFEYQETSLPVRDDIKQAHRTFWQQLSQPGSWWTGAQRVEIASASRQARHCSFCHARKQALSPYQFEGEHEHDGTLLDPLAVDAVHRIVTDQSRITRAYIDQNAAEGLSKLAYVELTGIVVAMISIDEFHHALGIELEPLPTPQAGEITRYVPNNLVEDMGFVPTISPDGTTGADADLWPPGQTANVVRALSGVPNALRDWKSISSAQYLSFEAMRDMGKQANRSIDRMQMELVAGRVSAINECFY